MNISFDGMVSNTLPASEAGLDATFFKRSRNTSSEQGSRRNKRVRRQAPPRDGAIQTESSMMAMSDESTASLDDLAESLRECTQRFDSSLLEFGSSVSSLREPASFLQAGSSSFVNNMSMNNFNTSMTLMDHSMSRLHFSSATLSVGAPAANSAPLPGLGRTRGPPPLMNFTRIPRGDDNGERL